MKLSDMLFANAMMGEGGGGGGSSDLSTATVTLVNNDGIGINGAFCANITHGDIEGFSTSVPISSPATIILYKGNAFMWADQHPVSISGNIEAVSENPEWIVTGDCTITF